MGVMQKGKRSHLGPHGMGVKRSQWSCMGHSVVGNESGRWHRKGLCGVALWSGRRPRKGLCVERGMRNGKGSRMGLHGMDMN